MNVLDFECPFCILTGPFRILYHMFKRKGMLENGIYTTDLKLTFFQSNSFQKICFSLTKENNNKNLHRCSYCFEKREAVDLS